MKLAWLTTYFNIALEADSPILEAIYCHFPSDSPHEVWSRLVDFNPEASDQPLVKALLDCNWKIIQRKNDRKLIAVSKDEKRCIMFESEPRGDNWWISEVLQNFRFNIECHHDLINGVTSLIRGRCAKVDNPLLLTEHYSKWHSHPSIEYWMVYELELPIAEARSLSVQNALLTFSHCFNGIEYEPLDITGRPFGDRIWWHHRRRGETGAYRTSDDLRSVFFSESAAKSRSLNDTR